MNPNTKKILTQSLAVLGVVVVTGSAYLFASSGNNFQAQLIGADSITQPALVDGADLQTPIDSSQIGLEPNTQAVSSVFDATPPAETAASTGSVMSGVIMSGTLLATTDPDELDEAQELIDLRPAAMDMGGANTLLEMFGGNQNTNTNATDVVSSAVTAADILAPFRDNQNATTTNTNSQDAEAKAALEQAPRVPQTGAESWLLSVSILCAMMGMTMLMTSPKQL